MDNTRFPLTPFCLINSFVVNVDPNALLHEVCHASGADDDEVPGDSTNIMKGDGAVEHQLLPQLFYVRVKGGDRFLKSLSPFRSPIAPLWGNIAQQS